MRNECQILISTPTDQGPYKGQGHFDNIGLHNSVLGRNGL